MHPKIISRSCKSASIGHLEKKKAGSKNGQKLLLQDSEREIVYAGVQISDSYSHFASQIQTNFGSTSILVSKIFKKCK